LKYLNLLLGFLSLVLFLCAIFFQRSYNKSHKEYDKLGVRPPVDPAVLADKIEFYRKTAIIALFLCPFPIAFIQHLERVAPISLLLTKLSVGVVIALFLSVAKLLLKVPFSWLWSAPLSWKTQISSCVLGLCTAWLVSSAYILLSDSTMRAQLTNTILTKLGG
jgi:hypothetical protein